jgi:hypothetical protein
MTNKKYYSEEPEAISYGDGGVVQYRWNILKKPVTTDVDEDVEIWECDEVQVLSPAQSSNVVAAVIEYLYGKDLELKYLNDFMSVGLGILPESYKDNYVAYLKDRKKIKESVYKDFERKEV